MDTAARKRPRRRDAEGAQHAQRGVPRRARRRAARRRARGADRCRQPAGRIGNPKTARRQILGGVVMGIGMALHEETFTDHRMGGFINHNFAEYHILVHADVDHIDVLFVDEPDPEVTPPGIKGLGEIGMVGTRVRDLPITIDQLLISVGDAVVSTVVHRAAA